MTKEEKSQYQESLTHYRNMVKEVGLERMKEVYRDALFMVVPHPILSALRDAVEGQID